MALWKNHTCKEDLHAKNKSMKYKESSFPTADEKTRFVRKRATLFWTALTQPCQGRVLRILNIRQAIWSRGHKSSGARLTGRAVASICFPIISGHCRSRNSYTEQERQHVRAQVFAGMHQKTRLVLHLTFSFIAWDEFANALRHLTGCETRWRV